MFCTACSLCAILDTSHMYNPYEKERKKNMKGIFNLIAYTDNIMALRATWKASEISVLCDAVMFPVHKFMHQMPVKSRRPVCPHISLLDLRCVNWELVKKVRTGVIHYYIITIKCSFWAQQLGWIWIYDQDLGKKHIYIYIWFSNSTLVFFTYIFKKKKTQTISSLCSAYIKTACPFWDLIECSQAWKIAQ